MKFVFDLDGTICTLTKDGSYDDVRPIHEMINVVNNLLTEGHRIVIFTARGMNSCNGDATLAEEKFREKTSAWLHNNYVYYHELIFGKPAADMYIDDKAICPMSFLSCVHTLLDDK